MEKLGIKLNLRGNGMDGMEASLIERTSAKAIYGRADGVFEVFYIKTRKANDYYGKKYPDREIYPTNEDFGKWAWCINDKERAMKKYKNM